MFSRFEPTYKGEVRSPMSKRSFYSLLSVAVAGVLLAIMLFPLSLFAHEEINDDGDLPIGHDGEDHVHYAENRTDSVRTFTSDDPEGAGIIWTVWGLDADDFTIDSGGVLRFVSPPDYENPTDRARIEKDSDGDTNVTGIGEGAVIGDDRNYQIIVSATEEWDGNDQTLPAKRSDRHLTVTVTNVDEDGEVTLTRRQPEVGEAITASLSDEDEGVTVGGWTWYRSKVDDPVEGDTTNHWTELSGADTATYIPQVPQAPAQAPTDVGRFLMVVVTYNDALNTGATTTTARMKSEHPVRAEVSGSASPDFGSNTGEREVSESLAVGDSVGDAFVATDADDTVLTYSLTATAAGTPNVNDVNYFDIDQATGQITVAQKLDADKIGDRDGNGIDETTGTAGEYVVVGTVVDPAGEDDTITITITAENANESPRVTGRNVLVVEENESTPQFALASLSPGEYIARDPEAGSIDQIADWDLTGADADDFVISGHSEPRYLNFVSAPDFENPTDSNGDNLYEVTIVAMDADPLGTGIGIGSIDVRVAVTNLNEDGEVVFTTGGEGYIDQPLVAEVRDEDDHGGDPGEPYQGVLIQTWQWARSNADNDAEFTDIDGATTNTYTPGQTDSGRFLQVTATYIDPLSADFDAGEIEDERVGTDSLRTESKITKNAVRIAPDPSGAPTFTDGGSTTREVAENKGPGAEVGKPVTANPPGSEILEYTLEGSDAKYFNIGLLTGQITVGGDEGEASTDPKLDHETKPSYSVTVVAKVQRGGSHQVDRISVTIEVTDVDELPIVTDEADTAEPPTQLPTTAPVSKTYAEIDEDGAPNTASVATFGGRDPEGNMIIWDVRGADASFFTIDGGVLKFRTSPDFENDRSKAGANTATPDAVVNDDIYSVLVRAIAARNPGVTGPAQDVEFIVNVTVGNVDEPGNIVLSRLQPELGAEITATLTDPDGGAPPVEFTWEVSNQPQSDLDSDSQWSPPAAGPSEGETFTPSDDDKGKLLRITAEYNDAAETDENDDNADDRDTLRVMTMYPVQAADTGRDTDGSPDFEVSMVERSVAENARVGARIAGPVTVGQGGTKLPGDRITYSLRAFDASNANDRSSGVDAPTAPDDDAAAFEIDQATGQITTAGRLNFEFMDDGTTARTGGKYVVVVQAVDPSGSITDTGVVEVSQPDQAADAPASGDAVVVVITATDVNDSPTVTGRPELTINENDNFVTTGIPQGADTENYYLDADEDALSGTDKWFLTGDDASEFLIVGPPEDAGGRWITFRDKPNFEKPTDADGDNVYKVTVVATDGRGGSAEFEVCIRVEDMNEAGEIALVDENGNAVGTPYLRGEITAVLTDEDGEIVTGPRWQWSRSRSESGTFINIDDDDVDATSDTYTPGTLDVGNYLQVTANYSDKFQAATPVVETTSFAVRSEPAPSGMPPMFKLSSGSDSVDFDVAENSPSGTYVGPLPNAEDDDTMSTALTYTLMGQDGKEGSGDAKYFALLTEDDDSDDTFEIVFPLQLVVKDPALRDGTGEGTDPDVVAIYDAVDLDHEEEPSLAFMLRASEGTGKDAQYADLVINITVADRNEAPSRPEVATGPVTPNEDPEFAAETATRTIAQGTAAGENIGVPITATDADTGDTLEYSLGGTDANSFAIDDVSGQLQTTAASEALAEGPYEVTVIARDGRGGEASVAVTITVGAAGSGTLLERYDANNDGIIDITEALVAIADFFAQPPQLSIGEALEIVALYFDGLNS